MRELRRLDLNLLVVLQTVLETRNVTAAARRLNMSQPAVSRALARLRTLFGDPLFVRGPKGVVATPRAEALYDRMAGLLAELGAAIETPGFSPLTSTRRFRVATTDYGALAVLTPVIGRLLAEAPSVGVDILPLTGTSFRELGTDDLDLVLYSDDPLPTPLLGRTLFHESYATVLRVGHPAADQCISGRMPMRAYLAHGHILVNLAGGSEGVVDSALSVHALSRNVVVTLPYFSTATLLAADTDLLLTLPKRVAERLGDAHGLIKVLPPLELETFGYRLLWHSRTEHDPASAWLRDRIATLVSEPPGAPN